MTDAAAPATNAAQPATGVAKPDLSKLPEGAVPNEEYAEKVLSATHSDPTPAHLKAPADGRPENVPEQFWDPEKKAVRTDELVKSYAELRAKMDGKGKDEKPADEPADADAEKAEGVKIERDKPADGEPTPLAAAVKSLADTYAETGEFPEEQVKALEDLGLPRETLDIYRAGLAALEVQALQAAYTAAGGEERFNAAVTWAKQNLTDDDLSYYNANVDNPQARTQTIEWLMAKFDKARPSEGSLVTTGAPSAGQGDVFTSQAQVTAAMRDPKYSTDPAYRQQVAEKLARSRKAGSYQSAVEYYPRG